jgi:hypothetical protein
VYSPSAALISSWYGFNALPGGSVLGNNLWSSTPSNTGSHLGNKGAQQASLLGSGDVVTANPGMLNAAYQPATTFDPTVISLQSGSAARSAGRATSSVAHDYFGTPRPSSGPFDIGAYQH